MRPRASLIPSEVPYLSDDQIAQETALLLAEYGESHDPIIAPPIPIDEILEVHLKLTYEISDLQTRFGVPDVLGAIWFSERCVRVDKSLDPDVFPKMLGRYHFTLAHEVGHWRLHRKYFVQDPDQLRLEAGQVAPAYVCRSSQKPPVERQADLFAAALLMPRDMVIAEWRAWRKSSDPAFLEDLWNDYEEAIRDDLAIRGKSNSADRRDVENVVMDLFSRPMAERFEVSAEAMRIRLETLHLLKRRRENTLF